MKFKTRAIHVNQHPDAATGSVIPPLYQTSTFAQEDAEIAPLGQHPFDLPLRRCGVPAKVWIILR